MTDLDPDTKARIEAEERYRAEVRARAGEPAPSTAPPPPPPPAAAPKKKRRGCGFWVLMGVLAFIVLGVIGNLMGGPSTTTSTPSEPAAQDTASSPGASDSQDPGSDTAEEASAPEPAEAETPAPSTTGDGTVNADGSQDVGVWRVSDVRWDTAQNIGGEYGETAGEGETFVRVQFTLLNNTNETQSYSSLIDQPQLILSDGSLIDSDTMLSLTGGSKTIDGQIAPGLKRTGSYAFRVPTGRTSGMTFQIQFFNGKRVAVALTQ